MVVVHDVGDEFGERTLLPARDFAAPAAFAFNLRKHRLRRQPVFVAGLLKRPISMAAEIEAISLEDLGSGGLLHGKFGEGGLAR